MIFRVGYSSQKRDHPVCFSAVDCYQKTKHPWQPDKKLIIIFSMERMQLCQTLLIVEILEFSISLLEKTHWSAIS